MVRSEVTREGGFMPVAKDVRERVKNRLGGNCYFFHAKPTPGNQYVHLKWHQGIGGLPEDHEVNQEENGAWGCQECHDLFHTITTPFKVEKYAIGHDENSRVLTIRDSTGEFIDPLATPIWYLLEPLARAAKEQRTKLEAAVRNFRQSGFEIAQGFEFFRDFETADLKRAWRRFQVFNDEGGTDIEQWENLPGLLGFSIRLANRFERQARWATVTGSTDLVNMMMIDEIDALRKVKDQAFLVELAAIAQNGKPSEFWAKLDEITEKLERMSKFELVTGPIRIVRGQMKDNVLHDDTGKVVEIRPGETIIKKGTILQAHGAKITEEDDTVIDIEEESDGGQMPDAES